MPADAWFAERVVATAPPEARPLHADDLHLTVAFLGGVAEAAARRAWDLRGAWRGAPRTVTLAEVVGMGPPRRFSALAALIGANRAELERAIAACRDPLLAAAGAAPERRAPLAHLTLARVPRRATGAQRKRARGWAAGLDLRDVRLALREIALYTWSGVAGAARFRVVERQPLA